jgi:predicted RNA-binding Zn-ribbon protein involved in translation (DUF1610 family)
MIVTAREIHCDGCGWWIRIDSTIAVEWPSLAKEGWTRDAGRHYCPKCGLHGSYKDHDE